MTMNERMQVADDGETGSTIQRRDVCHLAAGLLCFLSWMYCMDVASSRHVIDTTIELRYALLLLATLVMLL